MLKKMLSWALALALVLSCTGAFAAQMPYSNLEKEGKTKVELGVTNYFQWTVPEEVEMEATKQSESLAFNDKTSGKCVRVQNVVLANDNENDWAITIYVKEYSDLVATEDETLTIENWELRKVAYVAGEETDKYGFKQIADGSIFHVVSIPKDTKTAILTVRSDFANSDYSSERLLKVEEVVTALEDDAGTYDKTHFPVRAQSDVLQASDAEGKDVILTEETFEPVNFAASSDIYVDGQLYYSVWGRASEPGEYKATVTYEASMKQVEQLMEEDR